MKYTSKNSIFATLAIAATGLLIGGAAAHAQIKNPLKKSAADLESRIDENRIRFEERQAHKGKRIPAQILANARGIVIIHKVKAGLGIGGEIGNGVALVKKEDGTWSAPAFVSLAEGSFGFQIGAGETKAVLVLMTDESLNLLRQGISADIGVEIEATAGPFNAGGDLDTTTLKKPVLVYSDSAGAFVGASLKTGGIVGAKTKNKTAYGMYLNKILFTGTAQTTEAGKNLIAVIEKYSTTPAKN